jgi:hypothetical protein
MDANQNSIVDIITTIDLLSASVDSIMNDFGDANYDKSLDVKILMNSTLDSIAGLQFSNDEERLQIKTALVTKLKPAVEKLKQFYINRKNYLSAEYDVLTMTGQLEQSVQAAEQNVDTQDQSQEQSQSQTQEQGKVRTLFNPATRPSSYPQAA